MRSFALDPFFQKHDAVALKTIERKDVSKATVFDYGILYHACEKKQVKVTALIVTYLILRYRNEMYDNPLLNLL